MSFVEDNKTWILPVLGLGAAAVVWFNIRTFSTPEPAASPVVAPMAATPAPPPAPEPPPAPGSGEALWDDLRPVAFVPPDLEGRAAFEQQALAALGPDAIQNPAPAATHRGELESPRLLRRAAGPVGPPSSNAPRPDFLIEGPGGTQAWFDGHGYRAGQSLRGRPYTVQGIQVRPTPGVTLQGPAGSTSRSTHKAPVPEIP